MATKTVLTLDEIRNAIDNEDTGSALTATTSGFTGGTLAPVVEAAQAQATAKLAPDVHDTASEIFTAARRSTITGYLTSSVIDAMQAPEFVDYDPDLNHGDNARKLLREYVIPETSENIDALLKGGTAQDQATIASRLAKHQFDLEVLQRHGGAALTAAVVDPATLVTDIATFNTTRALRLGRTVAGIAGASANTGLLAAADAAGKTVTPLDYVVTAALTGGVYSLFGGQAGSNIMSGQANWFGKLQPQSTTSSGAVTRFFSEADKVAPTPQSREVARAVIDDPVRRDEYFQNNNAASVKRKLDNIMEGHLQTYDNTIETILKDDHGFRNVFSRKLDIGGAYTAAKDKLNLSVAEELLRRNHEFLNYGRVITPATPTSVTKAADVFQDMMNKSGEIAKAHGLPGFENFIPQPGYFHRAWNGSKIRALEIKHGPKAVRKLMSQAVSQGLRGIATADAKVIARAIIDRAKAAEAGMSVDFMGGLGKTDTESFVDMLKAGGLSGSSLDSAVNRLESLLNEKTLPRYARSRLPLDMTVAQNIKGGNLRMTDLIDTDLDRVARNYTSVMNGRSALSRAGVGKTDAEIGQWEATYHKTLADLPPQQFEEAVDQMKGVLGDFTGNIPEKNRLSQNLQRGTSLSNSTMLAAQGIWQVNELATMAHYFGLAETAKEMFRQFPGIRSMLKAMNGRPDLVDEVKAVHGIDLTLDVRWKPWMQQHVDFASSSNNAIDRVLHFGKQAMPFITAQKYVHSYQVKVAMNLALQRFARAMGGDAEAIAQVRSYGKDVDWNALFTRNRGNVTLTGKNASSMNWGLWTPEDSDTAMDAVLRYVDDAVLHGRTGQGTGFARSATGQVLGQFRSFVALAHNKQLRGTIHNHGKLAYAQLLALQYPLTVLMVTLNEARKGTLEIETEKDIQALLMKSVGYTAGLGFYADAANTLGLTGGRGGLGVPIVTATQAPSKIIGGIHKQFDDDVNNDDETAHDVAKGLGTAIPVIQALPGAAYYINSLKGE